MESLNLNNLANSLPSSSYANAEKELTNNFRAAALSLTTLYRSSKTASKRAYNAGYAAACHDLLNMIQQGVSTDADPSREVTIGRIMDYIEARLEAIKTREEEEDEEEERASRGVAGAGPSVPKPKPASPTIVSAPPPRRDQPIHAPPTPYTPSISDTSRPYASAAAVPALTPPTPSLIPLRPQPFQSLTRASRSRLVPSINPKDLSSVPLPSSPLSYSFEPPAVADLTVREPADVSVSSLPVKRRRDTVETAVADVSAASGTANSTGASSSRRRTRSSRSDRDSHHSHSGAQIHAQGQTNVQGEAMEVEEEGPQRKRVARR